MGWSQEASVPSLLGASATVTHSSLVVVALIVISFTSRPPAATATATATNAVTWR